MENVSDKSCRENQTPHFTLNNSFISSKNHEITRKNTVKPERPQMTIWRMRFVCWITEATDTHSEYVTLFNFSTATVVTRTRMNVTYIVCLVSKYEAANMFVKVGRLKLARR